MYTINLFQTEHLDLLTLDFWVSHILLSCKTFYLKKTSLENFFLKAMYIQMYVEPVLLDTVPLGITSRFLKILK